MGELIIFVGERGSGKTGQAIRRSHYTGYPIVVKNENLKDNASRLANHMQLVTGEFIVCDKNGDFSYINEAIRHQPKLIVDDFDYDDWVAFEEEPNLWFFIDSITISDYDTLIEILESFVYKDQSERPRVTIIELESFDLSQDNSYQYEFDDEPDHNDECSDNPQWQFHKQLLDDLHDTYIRKNYDYGDSFGKSIDEWGYISAIVRMSDKWNRLTEIFKDGEAQVSDETVEDTLLDLANYALMTVMKLREDNE